MKLVVQLKELTNRALQSFGYKFEKASENVAPLDVFDLLMRYVGSSLPECFFVQIGANDGVTGDLLRKYVLQYQWPGVLLEPHPSAFERLVKNYSDAKQLRFENAALFASDGVAHLYTASGGPDVLATFDNDILRKNLVLNDVSGAKVEKIEVRTISFSSLIAKYSIGRIDILQIDTEGFDFEVLKLFDFRAYRPIVVRYEHVHLSAKDRQASYEHMASAGYRLLPVGIDTVCFRPNS